MGSGPHRFSMGSEARSTAREGEGPPRTAPGASTQLVSHLASSGGGPFLSPLPPLGSLALRRQVRLQRGGLTVYM